MRRMFCAGLVVLKCDAVVAGNENPAATLFVVWQQNRATTGPVGPRASLGDMLNSITAPGDHVLAVKTTFLLSVH